MYNDHPGNTPVNKFDLYLPTIGPISTENSLHVLKFTREHICAFATDVNQGLFTDLKSCYTNTDTLTKKGHIQKMITFCYAAFGEKITVDMNKQLDKIN